MTGITHKQAGHYMRKALDGLLTEDQRLDLQTHLDKCEACRLESESFSSLTAHLKTGFQARWDTQHGPSQNVMANVQSQTRRVIMKKRIDFAFNLLGGAAALLVLFFLVTSVISQFQKNPPAANGTRVSVSTPQGNDRLLAFASKKDGNFDIYTMHADGSNVINLTNDPANDSSPAWSPDGKQIAFVSEHNGNADIFIMNPDGSNLTQLTDNPGYDGFFSWSPDGKKIVFSSSSKNDANIAQLIVMNADGGNKVTLTDPGFYIFLGWSLNGQKIVYQEQNLETNNPQDNEIHVMDIDGTNHYQWRAIIDQIKWTDDQHFIGHGWSGISEPPSWKISKFDANGSDPIELATYPSRVVALFNQTYLVEDTRTLAWYSSDGTKAPLKSWDYSTHCKKGGDRFLQDTSHTISPDETRAFVSAYCSEGAIWFYLENADGSQFIQLTDFSITSPDRIIESANWSPDGKYITLTIANQDGSKSDIYIFDIPKMLNDPTAQPIQLTSDGAMKYGAVWQPAP